MPKLNKIEVRTVKENFEFLTDEDMDVAIGKISEGELCFTHDDEAFYFNPKYIIWIRASKTSAPPY